MEWKPTLVNICVVNKGNAAATADRIMVLTAKADAANILHVQGSALMIIIAHKNSQICIHEVAL